MATDGIMDEAHFWALRLVFDTAALVLIWLVQLVIYPAFLHYHGEGFRAWHPVYTRRVTYVVMPIMLGQLALYGWLALAPLRWDIGLNLVLVLTAWAITFLRAVPLHGALDTEAEHLPLVAKLIAVNWWRTGLWTVVWGLTIVALLVQ
ncbi:hypothetical protein QWY85_01215 [Neolewinella lacunae]|uniref:DUF1772 domain-containing protein n=1 Tax=Neolewinella lacunae TaxID=1517758 RepID=A0A923T8V9_9BACT|nr:hypothetical protein [Neolewinella lacunae]MBC6994974.1 hypothetical protein [Neolewinella lacunae]MDN3633255.1 hypothetical protein [Neolewinella lacunae]